MKKEVKIVMGIATLIGTTLMANNLTANTEVKHTTETSMYNLNIKKIRAKMENDKQNYEIYLKETTQVVELDAAQKNIIYNKELEILRSKFSYIAKMNKLQSKLAFKESSNNPQAVNQYGYVGLFQLGLIAFEDIGRTKREHSHIKKLLPVTLTVYPVNRQISDVTKLINNNKKYLKKYNTYIGTTIKGVKITQDGMLAGAHLCGHSAVKKYLKTKGTVDIKDGNGIKVSTYIQMMAS